MTSIPTLSISNPHVSVPKEKKILTRIQNKVYSIATAIFNFFLNYFHSARKFFLEKVLRKKVTKNSPTPNTCKVESTIKGDLKDSGKSENASKKSLKDLENIKINSTNTISTEDLKSLFNLTDISEFNLHLSKMGNEKIKYLSVEKSSYDIEKLNSLIKSCPNLIELRLENCPYTGDQLRNILKNCPNLMHLGIVSISGKNSLSDEHFKNTLDVCPNLIKLNIWEDSSNLTSALFHYLPATLCSLKIRNTSIEHADLQNFSALEELDLDTFNLKSIAHMPATLQKLSLRIKTLDSQFLNPLSNLKSFTLDGNLKGGFENLPKNIRFLNLKPPMVQVNKINLIHLTQLEKLILHKVIKQKTFSLPGQLKEIALHNCDIYDETLQCFSNQLEKFFLNKCNGIFDLQLLPDSLTYIAINNSLTDHSDYSKFKHLKELGLTTCDIDDDSIKKLPNSLKDLYLDQCYNLKENTDFSHLKHLESLWISGCTNLKNNFLKTLPQSLKEADIQYCDNISENDKKLAPGNIPVSIFAN